jgi:hypothetical protein
MEEGASLLGCYSIRIPLIALAMTSCWISLVPSKIVWLSVSGFPGVTPCCGVLVTW